MSTAFLLLSVITPILVTLSATKNFGGYWTLLFQLIAIATTGAMAFIEGLRKIFAYDKRWASAYLSLISLQRARAEYKIKRIGLAVGGDEWKTLFLRYQNLFHDLIARETEEFFANFQKEAS